MTKEMSRVHIMTRSIFNIDPANSEYWPGQMYIDPVIIVYWPGQYYTIIDFWWGLLMTMKTASGIGWPTPKAEVN